MAELNEVPTDPRLAAEAWELAQTQYLGRLQMKYQPVPARRVAGGENTNRLRLR